MGFAYYKAGWRRVKGMLSDCFCKYCGEFLGRLHSNKQDYATYTHFKETHPAEFQEIKDAVAMVKNLRNKYKYSDYNFLR